jgi:NAD-dependent deacetylase
MAEGAMRRAEELTLSCNLFLAAGSSPEVWPAVGFRLTAKRRGAGPVVLDRGATTSPTRDPPGHR